MTTLGDAIEVPSVEELLVAYFKSRTRIVELAGSAARIGSRHPSSTSSPWLRIMATPSTPRTQHPRVSIDGRVQVEAYGSSADPATAQDEAQRLIEACAAALVVIDEDPDFTFEGAAITDGSLTTDPWRFPDPDFTPARERYLFDASISFVCDEPHGS